MLVAPVSYSHLSPRDRVTRFFVSTPGEQGSATRRSFTLGSFSRSVVRRLRYDAGAKKGVGRVSDTV